MPLLSQQDALVQVPAVRSRVHRHIDLQPHRISLSAFVFLSNVTGFSLFKKTVQINY